MKKKDHKLGAEAKEAIVKIATDFRNILGKTIGPAGRNYLLPTGITNDGKTIAQHIRYDDECEDNVAIVFGDMMQKTDDEVGDATTTTAVVGTTLAIDVMEKVPTGTALVPGMKSVMEIKAQLEEEVIRAVELLSKQVIPVTSVEELEHVAQTAMENPQVARLVAETVYEGGKDCVISLMESFTNDVQKVVFPGIKLPLKLAAPYLYNTEKKEAVHAKVPVLVVNHAFDAYEELTPFMADYTKGETAQPGRLIVIAKHYSVPFIQTCANVYRASQEKFQHVLLTADLTADQWEDLAAFVDARLIDTHPKNGRSIAEAKVRDLGLVEKLIAGEKQTALIGGRGVKAVVMLPEGETMTCVEARLATMQSQLETLQDKTKRKELEKRMGELKAGVATIYVGADTAVERHYLKLKIEDAINTCKAALDGGVVPGGGVALAAVATEMGTEALMYGALMAPSESIQANSGTHLEIGEDVRDAFLSTKAAVVNSVSGVKILITIEGIIADHVADPARELLAKLTGEE